MPLDAAVRSLITTFRRSPQWDQDLDLALLRAFWPELAGEQLAAATRVTAIRGATVVLNAPDLVWRRQLFQMKGRLLQKMNEPWGSRRFTEIAITYENH